MKLKEWAEQARTKVSALDADLIAMKALGFDDRVYLIMYSEDEFDMSKADEMLEKRVSGIPLAYITGSREFYGRDFDVNQNVLIPRPETEQMVISALGIIDVMNLDNVSILDVGSGSGCIPITLKLELDKENKTSIISGCDVSIPALETARNNAVKLGANVTFFESDLLANVNELPDVITANLPYVDMKWDWTSPELKYEPFLALYADDGGLKLIKKLIDEISTMKNDDKKRFLLLEADVSQLSTIEKYAAEKGFELVSKEGFILAFKY